MRGGLRVVPIAAVALLLFAAPAQAQFAKARIVEGPPEGTDVTEATFAFETSSFAPFTSFECSLDGAAYKPCSSPHSVSGLLGGPHSFAVRLVGRVSDAEAAVRRWTVLVRSELLPPSKPPPRIDPPRPTGPPRYPKRRDAKGCAFAGNRPGEVPNARLSWAVACAINRRRATRGLHRVRMVDSLVVGALRHARDMRRRLYFEHVSPDGSAPADRLRRSGYIGPHGAWTIGEVLAWGTGRYATPESTVVAWMHSPPHRHVLLHAAFRDIGVGVVRGIPARARADGGTFVGELGRR